MNIDFHTHGKLNKRIPFSKHYMDWQFQEAKTANLDAICLTEHFNTLGFLELYEYMDVHYEKRKDCYRSPCGIDIFPGMEVDIAQGGHTLLIGDKDSIVQMNQRLEAYKQKGSFIPFEDLVAMKNEYPVLFGAAHPFRMGSNIPTLKKEQMNHFDFFDLNGKDMAEMGSENQNRMEAFASYYHKPLLAGSDTHQSFQYGCIYNTFANKVETIKQLKEEIEQKNYRIELSSDLKVKVQAAQTIKKSLKMIESMGGDYLSILMGDVK